MNELPTRVTTKRAELKTGDVLCLPCDVNYYYITTDEQAKEAVRKLQSVVNDPNSMIAFDIETSGLDPFTDKILLAQIGTSYNDQYVFDMRKVSHEIISSLLTTNCWKVGHNIKFDAKFAKVKWKVSLSRMYDTMLAEMIIRGEDKGGFALDAVLKKRLNKEMLLVRRDLMGESEFSGEGDKVESIKEKMQESFLKMDPNESFDPGQLAYAAHDTATGTLFELVNWQLSQLQVSCPSTLYDSDVMAVTDPTVREEYEALFPPSMSLWETACLEFKFLEVVVDMELDGIGFDIQKHRQVMELVEQDYRNYKFEFLQKMSTDTAQNTLFGHAAINPDSPLQIKEALNRIGLYVESTKAEVLENTLNTIEKGTKQYDILRSLMGYRKSSKLMSTYGRPLMQQVHPKTGRLHYSVRQILNTGRISTSKPNLQNMPAEIEWKLTGDKEVDKEIEQRDGLRECFVAKEGYQFLIYDYSSQEMRIAAHITRDPALHKAFREGKDIHTYAASLMYHREYDEMQALLDMKEAEVESSGKLLEYKEAKRQRAAGKTLNLGSLYGSGVRNVSEKLHISMEEAQDIQARYWKAYALMGDAMKRYGALANKYGYSNTIIGRRRYYGYLKERITWINAEITPSGLDKKLRDFGMEWLLEKGPVTEKNMKYIKERAIDKYVAEINRQAGNHHIQGTAADMTKLAAIDIKREITEKGLDAKIVGLIHDEVIVEVVNSQVDLAREVVKEKMLLAESFYCPSVGPAVDGKSSPHWLK